MYPQLHIPDGFLSPQISLLLWVATAVLVGIAVRRTGRADVRMIASQPILMGVLGAFIFAAQMFNFPVATGTSGHLLGGVLAGYLLGPWAGTIVMATVVGIQALLFQDGGLLALGANIFNMGIIGTLGGSFVARGIGTALGGSRSATILGAGAAAWLAVVAAAGFTTLQLGLSGTTNIAVGLPAMLGVVDAAERSEEIEAQQLVVAEQLQEAHHLFAGDVEVEHAVERDVRCADGARHFLLDAGEYGVVCQDHQLFFCCMSFNQLVIKAGWAIQLIILIGQCFAIFRAYCRFRDDYVAQVGGVGKLKTGFLYPNYCIASI
jgi:cobalt/nickel transport system permease protein